MFEVYFPLYIQLIFVLYNSYFQFVTISSNIKSKALSVAKIIDPGTFWKIFQGERLIRAIPLTPLQHVNMRAPLLDTLSM